MQNNAGRERKENKRFRYEGIFKSGERKQDKPMELSRDHEVPGDVSQNQAAARRRGADCKGEPRAEEHVGRQRENLIWAEI